MKLALLVASRINDVLRWWETLQRVRRMRRRSYALTVRLIEMGVIK
ncbi:MAG: hypothetical protein OEV08_05095 [Nitrospira sp.]|nr:hypothetical protein [Nitrospira sp.]